MDFDFKEELKKLPTQPGVYLMYDKADMVIYVGKAISLRNRVRQYFREGADGRPKIVKMMPHVAKFEYVITDSELEALVLENNLIKEYSPKYNTMLKDGKTYPYIKVTVNEPYPRIFLTRKQLRDKAKYFGPYTNGTAVKETLELLLKLYQIRDCNRKLPQDAGKARPCLNAYIGLCMAPCTGNISEEIYRKSINQALDFLGGNHKPLIKEYQEKMEKASQELDFEHAGEYRDIIKSLKAVAQKQKITAYDLENRDIIAIAIDKKDAVVQLFFVRDGKIIGREHYFLTVAPDDSRSEILGSFINQYYGGTPYIPKELMLQEEPEGKELIEQWLTQKIGQSSGQQSNRKVKIIVPKVGQKEKLVDLAYQNAKLTLKQDRDKLIRENQRTLGAVKEIGKLINVPDIVRMEAYDISNISGFLSVGSMVVFEDGKAKKNDYRKFRLRTVEGPNDYASMYEVLTRRFSHGIEERRENEEIRRRQPENLAKVPVRFARFPDVILMDGGKGQVHIAEQVLKELKLDIPVCGMVKDDRHRTRGIFYHDCEIPIDTHGEGFKLVTRIQDEAHRFAIDYHKSLRSKNQVHSVLDDIKGVGPSRRKALMKHYSSIEDIKKAEVDELLKVDTINQGIAQNIYDFFHVE